MAKAHFCISLEDLARELDLPGEPLRIWIEPDTQYVHLMTGGEVGQVEYPCGTAKFFDAGNGYVETSNWRRVHEVPTTS